jgi:hypothetical protein
MISTFELNFGGQFMKSKKLISILSEKISKIDILILCLTALIIAIIISPQL